MTQQPRWMVLLLTGLFLLAKAPTARADGVIVFATPNGPETPNNKAHLKLAEARELPDVKLDARRGTIVPIPFPPRGGRG